MLHTLKNAYMSSLAPQLLFRSFSSVTVGSSAAEQGIAEKLKKHFTVVSMKVEDTSGGGRGGKERRNKVHGLQSLMRNVLEEQLVIHGKLLCLWSSIEHSTLKLKSTFGGSFN